MKVQSGNILKMTRYLIHSTYLHACGALYLPPVTLTIKCCKHLGKKLAAAPSAVDLTRVFEYIEKFKREATTEKISSFGQISFETCETLSPSELDLQRLLRKRTQSAYSIYEVTGQQAKKADFTAGL